MFFFFTLFTPLSHNVFRAATEERAKLKASVVAMVNKEPEVCQRDIDCVEQRQERFVAYGARNDGVD